MSPTIIPTPTLWTRFFLHIIVCSFKLIYYFWGRAHCSIKQAPPPPGHRAAPASASILTLSQVQAPLCVSLHDSWFANGNFVKPEYHWSLILFTRLIAGAAARGSTVASPQYPYPAGRTPLYPPFLQVLTWAKVLRYECTVWIFAASN